MKNIIVCLFSLFVINCASWVQSYDLGRKQIEVGSMRASHFPVKIVAGHGVDHNKVKTAVQWWNDEFRSHWTSVCSMEDSQLREKASCPPVPDVLVYSDYEPDVTVTVGPVPLHAAGRSHIEWNMYGEILNAEIVLPPKFWNRTILRHEIGHAAFGLDDDIRSLDLNSVMSSPFLEGSHLTQKDYQIIATDYIKAISF